jgi:branched-chain amino acid aminotransferase
VIHRYLLHNESILDASDPVLRPGQLGLLAGWGIFSTIRVAGGVLFEFERHWARMKRDAELLRVPFPSDPSALETALLKLIEANGKQDLTMRVVIVRNRGGVWEGPGNSREYDLIALTADLNNWGSSVRLGMVPQARHAANQFAGTKVLSWAQNLTWYEQAHADGFDEVVLLNERDEVSECTSANIFAVYGSTAATPPLSAGCLPGITRNLLLDEVRVPGIDVEERTLTTDDLERADQVFITSTTRALLPVAHIQGLTVRSQGDVCARLNRAFEEHLQSYVAARKRKTVAAESVR